MNHGRELTYLRMPPPFAASQTFVVVVVGVVGMVVDAAARREIVVVIIRHGVDRCCWRARQTVKSFGGVEVKLIPADQVVQAEESLHFLQFRVGVVNEPICLGESIINGLRWEERGQ